MGKRVHYKLPGHAPASGPCANPRAARKAAARRLAKTEEKGGPTNLQRGIARVMAVYSYLFLGFLWTWILSMLHAGAGRKLYFALTIATLFLWTARFLFLMSERDRANDSL